MKVANCVFLDIVCDNAGYELFSDMCIGHWVISQGFVDKVRFHVKKYPWFVSDVTKKDLYWLVGQCRQAKLNKDAVKPPRPPNAPPIKPNKDGTMPVQPPDFRRLTSNALNIVANEWRKFIDDGRFLVVDEDFWTYPHTFDRMKQIDPYMYRNLQYAAMILFKGDLNYRKLVGEKNCVPYTKLQQNLQGFMPAPLVALRTVKSETVCGLPKGRYEQLLKFDPEWMQKGNFGVISMNKKGEAFPKQPNMPCVDYGETCYGEICPPHKDF
ncbi:hypothetical protein O0L34_g10270 [Tuta absoluta]|nr:hypothetical protein O0L34_g10270 [Tuta absoluta]